MIANVPRGLYRNAQGAQLRVTGTAMTMTTGHNTLAGDIAVIDPKTAKCDDAYYVKADEDRLFVQFRAEWTP